MNRLFVGITDLFVRVLQVLLVHPIMWLPLRYMPLRG